MERPIPEIIQFTDERNWRELFTRLKAQEQIGHRSFPAVQEYRKIAQQIEQEISSESRSIGYTKALIQREWHIRGKSGCQFARLGALQANQLRWDYIVFNGVDCSGRELDVLTTPILQATRDSKCQLLSILFPEVSSARELVNIIRRLTITKGRFWLERDEVDDNRILRLYLRYSLEDTKAQAWVMAFGPMKFLPPTRQSPYAELVIRVKPKPPDIFHRLNQDRNVAHLADIPLEMPANRWEHRWSSTRSRTRMILGAEPDETSAARATFSVPLSFLR